ncbi:MAG: prepilin-type N-terminal cleavage/methylation domain-containing protein [Candidatus Omnitrophica bacterium]|nr:prepilin-type N-terminal cleavage/methylation domain-containing protein [Candidatus Omnitrophota bacterium]
MIRGRGFTLIEVIVAVTIVAIIMLPMTAIEIEYIREAAGGDAVAQALNLAKREIAIVNNLDFNDSTLRSGYDNLTTPYLAGYNFELRRTVSSVMDASGSMSNLKKVAVRVYPLGFGAAGGCGGSGCSGGGGGGGCGGGGGETATNQMIEIDTYVMNNVEFGAGTAGGTISSTEASALEITGTGFSNNKSIRNIPMRNARTTGNITVTAIYVWANVANRTLTSVVMWGGMTVYSGVFNLPASRPASPNIILQPTCIINYSAAADTSSSFTFSTNFSNGNVFNVVYKMSDGSEVAHSWTR